MDIKSYQIDNEYFVTEIPDFESFKGAFKEVIKDLESNRIETDYERVDYTDWDSQYDEKVYAEIVREKIDPFLQAMAEHLYCNVYAVHEFWYQRYKETDYHKWHNHVGCMYSNVLYVDLPDSKYSTQIFNRYNNKIIQVPDLQEGMILSFPSNYAHMSPPIEKGEKSILSFNVSYFDMKRDIIDNLIKGENNNV